MANIWSISKELKGFVETTENPIDSIESGEAYVATFRIQDGCTYNSHSVFMDGIALSSEVTYNDKILTINIPSVTGAIFITAFAFANLSFLHGNNIKNHNIITPGTFYLDTEANELWYDDPGVSSENGHHIRLFDAHFNNIYNQLADLAYEQIEIKKFALNNKPSLVEYGEFVEGPIIFDWEANKPPTYLTITELSSNKTTEPVSTSVSAGTAEILPLTNLTDTTTYRLTLGDERTRDDDNYNLEDATAETTITFCYPIFYGTIQKNSQVTSDTLKSENVNKVLKTSYEGTYTIECGESDDNLVTLFAIPAEYEQDKSATFMVNGFKTTYPMLVVSYSSETFTPYTINYNVYYGTNVGLGTETISVI